ncbi:hypothetical protein [Kingella oralis]|nr:hypothetical protein [Kingella oralis]
MHRSHSIPALLKFVWSSLPLSLQPAVFRLPHRPTAPQSSV